MFTNVIDRVAQCFQLCKTVDEVEYMKNILLDFTIAYSEERLAHIERDHNLEKSKMLVKELKQAINTWTSNGKIKKIPGVVVRDTSFCHGCGDGKKETDAFQGGGPS